MNEDLFLLEEDNLNHVSYCESAPLPFAKMNSECRKDFWATLALRHCPKMGPRTRGKLLKFYGSAFNALENRENWISLEINPACAYGIRNDLWREEAHKEWLAAQKTDAYILLWSHSCYPFLLRELVDPPALLYCKGDLSLLQTPAISVVGSRHASPQSLKISNYFASSIASCGIAVVSGMAMGIDKVAHAAAISQIGSSIGVLGTGIDIIYPGSNENLFHEMSKKGLLVSEFAPGAKPHAANFPIRNRIISGLSLAALVIEAAERSGSLITARYAVEQNREVFAVPGALLNDHTKGCQNLIRQGAHPAFSIDDILRDLADSLKSYNLSEPISFEPILNTNEAPASSGINEQEISKPIPPSAPVDSSAANLLLQDSDSDVLLEILSAKGPMLIDALADEMEKTVSEVTSIILGLEIFGKIKRLPGSRVELCR